MSILITRLLNSASDRLSVFLLLSYFFLGFDLFFHLGHIALSWCTCYRARGGAFGIQRGRATLFAALGHCLWGRGQRGDNASGSCPTFHHFPHFPQVDCAFSGAASQVNGFVYVLGPCGHLQWTLMWDWEFSPPPQPPQIFYSQGFWVFSFPCWNPGFLGLPRTPIVPSGLSACQCGINCPCVLSAPAAYQSGWMFL